MENNVLVNGKPMELSELEKLQEDPKVRLKKIKENEYSLKERLLG
jgi:hypothetical protein